MEYVMATIGTATPGSSHFPLASVVTATFRLISVLAIAWGSIQLILGIISTVILWVTFAAADSDVALYGAVPSMVGGLDNGLALLALGVVLAVVAKRLTQFVMKHT